ncbi:AlpA family transcriptional regulator [Ruegeria sp. 6PALISEP08]|uniref:helix-turn-helix transcriptional regulator n=1 Tax=Ruegeria sp. 6PALISEP08 TaxID=1225660 RepID=UPI00067F3FB6|nr:AlpA family phage regulatory protein [Ruegeria sp. 6PALISEP08]
MPDRILRRPAVEDRTGKSRSGIYEAINPKSRWYDPTFPKPVKIGLRSVGWFESEVNEWIKGRIAA